MNPPLAVLVPLYTRVERIPALASNLAETTPEATLFFRVCEQTPSFKVPANAWMFRDRRTDYPSGINFLAGKALELGFPMQFVGADDLIFHPGWYETALHKMKDGILVVGTNDMGNPRTLAGQHATHFLVSAKWEGLEKGTVLSEAYGHSCVDDELFALANARGVYAHAHDSVVEHQHPLWGFGQMDETYAKGQASYEEDIATFEQRRRLWEKVPA